VTVNQTLAEVETAKAIVQLPSPFAGRIAKLYAEAGTTVAVGSPIVGFELERFFDFEHAGDSHPEITHCAYYVAQPKAEPVNG